MDELHHECGIASLYHLQNNSSSPLTHVAGPEQVSRLMPRMLLDLQNRGQLAAGFSTYNPRREQIIDTYRQVGTVIEAFRLNHPAKAESAPSIAPAQVTAIPRTTPNSMPATANAIDSVFMRTV